MLAVVVVGTDSEHGRQDFVAGHVVVAIEMVMDGH